MLVADRSIEPRHGHVVLDVNNEHTVKQLYNLGGVVERYSVKADIRD
jgi:DNA polymerase V